MGIVATDPALPDGAITYYFKVNGVEYNFETNEGSTSYEQLILKIDTAIAGAGFGAQIVSSADEDGTSDIRIFNDTIRGSASRVILESGDSSPDLFGSLNFWSRFRYDEVKALEGSSDSFVIERTMSGRMDFYGVGLTEVFINPIYIGSGTAFAIGGSAYTYYIPTMGTAFYGDTYYQDEFYGDAGEAPPYIPPEINYPPNDITHEPYDFLGWAFIIQAFSSTDVDIFYGVPADPDGDPVHLEVLGVYDQGYDFTAQGTEITDPTDLANLGMTFTPDGGGLHEVFHIEAFKVADWGKYYGVHMIAVDSNDNQSTPLRVVFYTNGT